MPNTTVNDVELHYLEWGTTDTAAPLAVCLHGFPDSAHTWRLLGPELAEAGFRVVAPFLRGYAPSAVPADGRYQSGMLASDALELRRALGGDERAVVVGHDWGAIATWAAAAYEPASWAKVVAMAVPPAGAVGASFMRYEQLKKSWYMFFFQHALSDVVVGLDDLAFIDGLWADWSPGYDAAEDLELLKPSLRSPENLAAALGYYRATLSGVGVDPALDDIQGAGNAAPPQPTLYLHGVGDGCIGIEVADGVESLLAEGSRVERVEGAGHFLHLERPDVVNPLVVDFLS